MHFRCRIQNMLTMANNSGFGPLPPEMSITQSCQENNLKRFVCGKKKTTILLAPKRKSPKKSSLIKSAAPSSPVRLKPFCLCFADVIDSMWLSRSIIVNAAARTCSRRFAVRQVRLSYVLVPLLRLVKVRKNEKL